LPPRLLAHTARALLRSPYFTASAVLSLAIGIGANTAIFTAANALLIAPTTGVRDPGGLVDIGRTTDGQGFDTVGFTTYRDVAAREDVFSGVYATRIEPEAMSLGSIDGAERVYAEFVSASYFDVLGVQPAAGTFFRTDEEQPGVPLRKVVLTDRFWQRRFGRDPAVVGREIRLNGDPFIVAGIAAHGFQGTTILSPDLWVPLTAHARSTPTIETLRSRESAWLMMGARLVPGVSMGQASQAMQALAAQLRDQYPEVFRDRGLTMAPYSRVPGQVGQFATAFLAVLMGLVGLVQVVACTNLAGLMLARTTARAREVAVRLSLGASRRSIVGLLLTESLLLFGAGAILALAVSRWTSAALASVLTSLPVPVAVDLSIDWRVLVFTASLALLTGVFTGLVPALQGSRSSIVSDLKADAMAPRRRRLRHVFVGSQIAACVVLVALAGLFVQALARATQVDTGMNIDGVDVAGINLNLSGRPEADWPAVADELRRRFADMPGVVSVGAARMVPLQGGSMGLGALRKAGDATDEGRIDADWNVITPGFLTTVGIPLLRGRDFTDGDREGGAPVAVVSERLAELAWPGEDPIGRVMERGDFRQGRETTISRVTVIGVARNARSRSLGEAPRPFVYVPLAQNPTPQTSFFIRRNPNVPAAASFEAATRAMLRDFDRNLPLVDMKPFREHADVGLLPQRIASAMAGLLGSVALALAAIGIYGVAAFAVATRTREIGVRVALGADPSRIRWMVLWQGLRVTAIGGAAGLLVALLAGQLASGLLFGVPPADPIALGVTAAGVVAVAIAASFAPARRAATLDPVRALRAE